MGIPEELKSLIPPDAVKTLSGFELSESEWKVLLRMVHETSEHGKSDTFQSLSGADWKIKPVTGKEFIEDPYYLGWLKMYPGVKADFIDIVDRPIPSLEVILTGSVRWGKSYLSSALGAYDIYVLSCMKSPQAYLGIDPATPIYFLNVSVTGYQASEGVFSDLTQFVDNSPYFKNHFPRDPNKSSSLIFPHKIIAKAGNSSEFSAIGKNVYWAMIDETNFFGVKKNSTKSLDASGEYDAARALYEALVRRIRLTYTSYGVSMGRAIISSSARYPQDFIEKKKTQLETQIEKGEDDGTTVIKHHSVWDVKDPSVYVKPKFRVLLGTESIRSRILEDSEEVPEMYEKQVLEVPGEFKSLFQDNLETAIRDVAGVSTRSTSLFFKNPEALPLCFTDTYSHPYTELVSTDLKGKLIIQSLCKRHVKTGKLVPKVNPNVPRGLAFDLSTTGDPTGLVMGHISGFKEVTYFDKESTKVIKIKLPIVRIDLILRILPPPDYEIDQSKIAKLVGSLKLFGFQIGFAIADKVESTALLQLLRRKGIPSKKRSSRRKGYAPYHSWKAGVYQQRFQCYEYPPLLEEMQQLEDRNGVIDHPAYGYNDLSDVVANLFDALSEDSDTYGVVFSDSSSSSVETNESILGMSKESLEVDIPNDYDLLPDEEKEFQSVIDRIVFQGLTPEWKEMEREGCYIFFNLLQKRREFLENQKRSKQAQICEREMDLIRMRLMELDFNLDEAPVDPLKTFSDIPADPSEVKNPEAEELIS